MIHIDDSLTPQDLKPALDRMWDLSARKIRAAEAAWNPAAGAPVFTVEGRWTSRGWTEWTQGFQFGSALLQFDATGETEFLELGRNRTHRFMAPHLTHLGVHDHGFNNVSTYGNLRRLALEGRFEAAPWELRYYELALKVSGAAQASRWTELPEGGFIHSFNGAHSLFADTIRSLRALALSHALGHRLCGEQDESVSLLRRLIDHAEATARYTVYYGDGRDAYDLRGRVAHESVFNVKNGSYRCPNSQQGYSPFSTWTRGLAWVMLGFPEQIQFLDGLEEGEFVDVGADRATVRKRFLEAARATCDFYLEHTPVDGIPYWDTGAPGLAQLDGYLDRPADPDNAFEPVDSSAAAIGCQGLLRLGDLLLQAGDASGRRYRQAGLTVLKRLLEAPYLGGSEAHHGLLLHTIYHRPNGWDHVPAGSAVPKGESCQWGDYHLREAALQVTREIEGRPAYGFAWPAGAAGTVGAGMTDGARA